MEHLDKVASIVHAAKNRLQLLQPALNTLQNHGDSEVAVAAGSISGQLGEINQQLVLLLSLYRLDQTELLNVDTLSVSDLTHSAAERTYDPRVKVEPFPELEVFGDERLLQAVIGDAIHNGLRHCQHEVMLTARPEDKGVLIRVLDDGDPQSQSSSETGSGVGLWIANKIASAHRNGDKSGYAHHEFKDGLGSCFELFIP